MPPWTEEEASTSQHIIFSNSSRVGNKLVMLQHLSVQKKRWIQIQLCPWIQLCVLHRFVPRLFPIYTQGIQCARCKWCRWCWARLHLKAVSDLHKEIAAPQTEIKVWASLFKWTGYSPSFQDGHFFHLFISLHVTARMFIFSTFIHFSFSCTGVP